jgi:hypothetical protein
MPGRFVVLLWLARHICIGAAINAECISEDSDECSMSSLLLQTEKSLSKNQLLATPAEVGKSLTEHEVETIVAAHKALRRQLLHNLGNASATLQRVLDTPDESLTNSSLTDIVNVRDAIVLAIPNTSAEDMSKLAPVGVTLSKAAEDFSKLATSKGRDGLKSVLAVLTNVSLPDEKTVLASFHSKDPQLPAESIYYGNYCGQFRPPAECGIPLKTCKMAPIDPLDSCCKDHDYAYEAAYKHLRCEKKKWWPDLDEPDCVMYDKAACIKLSGYDETLSMCAKEVNCPSYDTSCNKAKSDIDKLYGNSLGHYAAGELACPPKRD